MTQVQVHPFLLAEDIQKCVVQVGRDIRAHYGEGTVIDCVVVLTGAFTFASDLVRQIGSPLRLHFVRAASYQGTTSTGNVRVSTPPRLSECHVLLIEDIVDTGQTLDNLLREFRNVLPKSLRAVSLLDKPSRRLPNKPGPDFTGFIISDSFVVGYGMDWNERYRELPYIGIIGPSEKRSALIPPEDST